MDRIEKFDGQYQFLSNLWPCEIVGPSGFTYPSVEHAFQASKSLDCGMHSHFICGVQRTAGEAKKLGRSLLLRGDWEKIKLAVMARLIRQKFEPTSMRQKLLMTYPAILIEGNHWGDTFWGVCNGVGENWLGRILMCIRSEMLLKYGE